MNWKTSEFARRLGITREALRYYEKSGLLSPGRCGENNYRAYSDADGFEILRIRDLQAHHVPLSEAKSLMRDSSLLPHRDQLSAIEDELQARIRNLSAQLERIRRHRMFVEEAMADGPAIQEMDTYGMYQLMLLGEGVRHGAEAGRIASEWIASMPFTEIGWRIPLPEGIPPEDAALPAQIGLQAMPHCAFACNLSMEPPVEFSPPAHSVRIMAVTPDPFLLPVGQLMPLLLHIREKGYQPFSGLCGHFCGCSGAEGSRLYHFTVRALVRRPPKGA